MKKLFRILLIIGIFVLFAHKGRFSDFLYSGKNIPEGERIHIILTHYFSTFSPTNYYAIYFEFYNRYMGFLSKHLYEKIKNHIPDQQFSVYISGRFISIIFLISMLILLIYIGNRIFFSPIGEISAVLCLFTPAFAYFSQTGLHHFHSIFWYTLAYYFIIRSYCKPTVFSYALAGFFTGLSIAFIYTHVLLLLISIFLLFINKHIENKKKLLLSYTIAVILGLLFGTPSIIYHPDWLFQNIYYFIYYRVSGEQYKNPSLLSSLWFSIFHMFPHTFGVVVWVLSLIGIVYITIEYKNNKENLLKLFLITVIISLIILSSWGVSATPPRIMFLSPLLSISSSFLIWKIILEIKRQLKIRFLQIVLSGAIFVAIIGSQVTCTIAHLNVRNERTPFQQMVDYINSLNLNRAITILMPLNFEEPMRFYPFKNKNKVKVIFYNPYNFQESNVFFQTQFDYACVENLDVIHFYLPWRTYYFRKNVNNLLKANKMDIIKVFSNTSSFIGIELRPPFNDPSLSFALENRIFLIGTTGFKCEIYDYSIWVNRVRKNILKSVINIKSKFSSNGYLTIKEIVKKISEHDVDVIIFSDSLLRKWRLKIFGKDIIKEQNSVFKIGIERWLDELKKAQTHTDILIIPGVECVPYYYWTGHPLLCNLTLNNGSKHLLIIGLDVFEDYASLIEGIDNRGVNEDEIVVYNHFIEKVISRKGLVFWSHPDRLLTSKFIVTDFVRFRTLPYGDILLKTKNYTGFCALSEGMISADVGSYWDQALIEYCNGKRGYIPYIIGEVDYGKGEDPKILNVFTMIYNTPKKKEKIINALAEGKCYVTRLSRCGHSMYLEYFQYREGQLSFSIISEHDNQFSVQLIRNGKLYRVYSGKRKLSVKEKILSLLSQHETKQYFRLVATDEMGGILLSNPIFICDEIN